VFVWCFKSAGLTYAIGKLLTNDDGDYVFRALDNRKRTDTWLSNQRELGDTNPWDPDTDDDGLTDGQEVKGVTNAVYEYPNGIEMLTVQSDPAHTYHTSPRDNDTDGDGYWDGWLGVYSVENSTNVILYMEHLRDDDNNDGRTTTDGLAPGERVPAQAGTHHLTEAPSARGADVDDDDANEHANIHVGELQWGTNPDDRENIPSPELSVEVDYYADADHQPLDTQSWENGIEDNYALYGIDVNIIRDETLTDSDFVSCIPSLLQPYCIEPDDGFGYEELYYIGLNHGSTGADEYVFVGHKAGSAIPDGEDQSGVNLYGVPYQGIFVQGNQDEADEVTASTVRTSPYETGLALVAAKSEIHEIGHSFGAGELDDRSLIEDPGRKFTRDGEVYSGRPADETPETVRGSDEWSIMSSGWNGELDDWPMKGRYFAYSIEELLSMR
jgi:hypothetical protein